VVACLTMAVLCALASAIQSAGAQTLYRYTNEKGVVVYTDTPTSAAGQAVDRMSGSGTHLKRPASPDKSPASRPAPDTVPAPAPEATAQSREAEDIQRRNTALLSTYNSVQEIEASRAHALREPLELLRQAQKRMVAAGRLVNQIQRSTGNGAASRGAGGAASPAVPSDTAQQLENARFDLKTQAQVTQNKLHEVEIIEARFDDDLKRYNALTNPSGIQGAPR